MIRGHHLLLVWLIFGLTGFARSAERAATPVSSITVQPGFRVELLRSAEKDEGSWISMTFDDRGRLIVGLDHTGIARVCATPFCDGFWKTTCF